jgi:hypothetical protein
VRSFYITSSTLGLFTWWEKGGGVIELVVPSVDYGTVLSDWAEKGGKGRREEGGHTISFN